MNRKISYCQLISIACFVFLFSSNLSTFGQPLLVPHYSDPADQGLASLIFNNCYSRQIHKTPLPSNTTIQTLCNQKVIDDLDLSHSVANGMEAVPSSFGNLPGT